MKLVRTANNIEEDTYEEYKNKYGKKKVSTAVEPEEIPDLLGNFSFLANDDDVEEEEDAGGDPPEASVEVEADAGEV